MSNNDGMVNNGVNTTDEYKDYTTKLPDMNAFADTYQNELYQKEKEYRKLLDLCDLSSDSNVNPYSIEQLYAEGLDAVFLGAGWGEHNRQITNNYAKLNRFGTRFVMDNYLKTGYTFMTRPELNLTSGNLQQNRIMNLLNNSDPSTMAFALRCYLDTRYARALLDKTMQCPFIDYRNPFFTLITNNLTDFSGGPSHQLDVFTDEQGFYGESQSFAKGSDSYRKPFDLQLGVIDPIGGPIDAAIKYWMKYIELINRGEMIMYPDQSYDRILNYTVSIYRFVMDPSFRFIRRWVKYTGCFPISRPGASIFDFSSKDIFVDQVRKFSIGFRCGSGHVDEDDPIVIQEFNSLVERYYPTIKQLKDTKGKQATTLEGEFVHCGLLENTKDNRALDKKLEELGLERNPILPEFNYTGIPYIFPTSEGLRLEIISEVSERDQTKHHVEKFYTDGRIKQTWPRMQAAAANIMQLTQNSREDITEHIRKHFFINEWPVGGGGETGEVVGTKPEDYALGDE